MATFPTWTLLIQGDGGDYYAGEDAALYRDGLRVWDGSSCDAIEGIVRAIFGDAIEVRRGVWESFPEGVGKDKPYHFYERLADQPEPIREGY